MEGGVLWGAVGVRVRGRWWLQSEIPVPPHITSSITCVTQEANRGYNLTFHNATDNTVCNFPVEFFQGHWYTLVRHPSIPDEYYVFNDDIIEHRQFRTRFPLRDDPYCPDYKPFYITLTLAVTTQGLPSIPEQTEGAGPFNVVINGCLEGPLSHKDQGDCRGGNKPGIQQGRY